MPNASPLLFQSCRFALTAAVDAETGIIRQVAVITQGPALSHGMMVDRTTLEQIKRAAESFSGGLKVKLNHSGGVSDIVGFLRNFAITGDKLVADLHLLKTAQARAYIIEIAQTIPDTFGLSVAFSGDREERDGVEFARCSEIYSCDLVTEPAANPDGLFSQRFDEWQKTKGTLPETTLHMENDLLKKIGELIDAKLATVVTGLDAKISALETAQKASLSKIEEVSQLSNTAADKAALSAVKEFAKTLGQPAGAAAAPSAPAAAPVVEKFETLVKAHPKYATSKLEAQKEVIAAKPAVYGEYLNRVQHGEVILF